MTMYGLYHWKGSGWGTVSGGAVAITVGPAGNAWVVNNAGSIFEYAR